MNKLIIKVIIFYQNHISKNTTPCCRYTPTCSQYSLECFQKFSFFKALFLTIFRILRCNPLSKGGYNPVPLTKYEENLKQFFHFIDRPS